MGLFDSVRKRGPRGATDASAQQLAQLRSKYRDVLAVVEASQVRVQNLHAADGCLYLKGVAPSAAVRERILDAVRTAGGQAGDIQVDLTVSSPCPSPDEVH
jgi:hypothetical protein